MSEIQASTVSIPAWLPGCRSRSANCSRALAVYLLVSVSTVGCVSFSKKPVADNVVNARELTHRGMDAMQGEHWDDAEELFAKAVEACPVDERAHHHYAETIWRRGKREEAIRHMEEAVWLSGGTAELLVQLGQMHLAVGDLRPAAMRARQAIQANRKLAAAWALLGDVQRKFGQTQEALTSYHRALSYQPHYPHVQLAASEIYYESHRPQRALSTLVSLMEQFPGDEQPFAALYLQGLAFKALGRNEDAADSFLAACRRGDPTVDLLFHLGEAQLLAGDPASADLTVDEALAQAPEHVACHQLKSRIQVAQRRMASLGPR